MEENQMEASIADPPAPRSSGLAGGGSEVFERP
jgi:hypothetical protein